MKLKIFVFFILLIILISCPTIAIESIYLGDFTPKEDIHFDFILEWEQFDNLGEDIIIGFKNHYFTSDKNSIPISRFYLNLKNERINLNTINYQISKDQLLKDVIGYFIPISFRLKPNDKPGRYKNTILLKTSEGKFILEKELIFEINSWARYELSTNNYIQIINNDLKNNKVKSSGGLILKVAANTNWELYCSIDEEGNEVVKKLNIYLSKELPKGDIQRNHIKMDYKPRLISKGNSTVNDDNYWTELVVYLEIEDIKEIKAGLKKFPIIFRLENK